MAVPYKVVAQLEVVGAARDHQGRARVRRSGVASHGHCGSSDVQRACLAGLWGRGERV